MTNTFFKTASVAVLAVAVAACGAKVEKAEVNPKPHDAYEGAGVLSGKSGDLLSSFKGIGGKGGTVASTLAVNPYIWRSTLEALSFMPLAQTSSQDGVIITDWFQNPNDKNERVKVNVLVMGKQFMAQNLKVSVFKQSRTSGMWVDAGQDQVAANQLEETILTNARTLKVKTQASR